MATRRHWIRWIQYTFFLSWAICISKVESSESIVRCTISTNIYCVRHQTSSFWSIDTRLNGGWIRDQPVIFAVETISTIFQSFCSEIKTSDSRMSAPKYRPKKKECWKNTFEIEKCFGMRIGRVHCIPHNLFAANSPVFRAILFNSVPFEWKKFSRIAFELMYQCQTSRFDMDYHSFNFYLWFSFSLSLSPMRVLCFYSPQFNLLLFTHIRSSVERMRCSWNAESLLFMKAEMDRDNGADVLSLLRIVCSSNWYSSLSLYFISNFIFHYHSCEWIKCLGIKISNCA